MNRDISSVLSHLTWVRGLKLVWSIFWIYSKNVAPYVGAWVETCNGFYYCLRNHSRTLRGCVGWNLVVFYHPSILSCRTLRGCVGWNLERVRKDTGKSVAPYVGAWVETVVLCWNCLYSAVAPYVGAWVETLMMDQVMNPREVAPYVGAWVETLRRTYLF